jgi:hypothetical protein
MSRRTGVHIMVMAIAFLNIAGSLLLEGFEIAFSIVKDFSYMCL